MPFVFSSSVPENCLKFRREGLIWLQRQLCVLGIKALVIIDTSGFVATILRHFQKELLMFTGKALHIEF